MSKSMKKEREESREVLLHILSPGDTVYTILRSVSRSGMSRRIDLCTFKTDGEGGVYWRGLTYHTARLLDMLIHRDRQGLRVDGAGMDVGFHVVYNLGRALWPEGGPMDKSVRHSMTQFAEENNGMEPNGGYLLRHEWL